MLTLAAKQLIARARFAHQHRFQHEHDWLRLSVLGGILLSFSTLVLAGVLGGKPLLWGIARDSLVGSGAAIALFIVRIARTGLYADWLLGALLYIGAGFSLVGDAQYDSPPPTLFCLLLMACAATRSWTGLTAFPCHAGAWLRFSGGIALACGVIGLSAPLFSISVSALSLVAVDLLFHGVAVVGFSIALRDAQICS